MIIRLDSYDLQNAFKEYDRDYYSPEAYEYILDYYDDIDPDMELDVIGLCSEIDEFETVDELKSQWAEEWNNFIDEAKSEYAYDNDIEDESEVSEDDLEDLDERFKDYIRDNEGLIELSNGNLLRIGQ